jgi:hypothetical protein
MNPRIYTYKITFEEVPYYYYGVHKEKNFNEEYWGSPKTNKWCWELYTPKKQILEVFEYSNNGWIKATEIETELIKPVYNNDIWCLNDNCGGNLSLEARSRNGKKGARKNKEQKTAIFGLTKNQRKEIGLNTYEKKVGIHTLTSKQRSEYGKIGAKISKGNLIGFFSLTSEQIKENAKKGGLKSVKNKVGVHSLTKTQLSECGKKGGKKGAKAVNAQKWQCLVTGYVSTPAGLSRYQKARGIDISERKRIQ